MTFDLENAKKMLPELVLISGKYYREAIAEIERLQNENDQLRSALNKKCDQFDRYLLATEDIFKTKDIEIARLQYILDNILWTGVE